MLARIREGAFTAVHDISDGGLAVALAEMAVAGGLGATIAPEAIEGPAHAFLFGEDQGRYVATARPETADAAVHARKRPHAGVAIARARRDGRRRR